MIFADTYDSQRLFRALPRGRKIGRCSTKMLCPVRLHNAPGMVKVLELVFVLAAVACSHVAVLVRALVAVVAEAMHRGLFHR